tara:strand:+ start:382 stop:873 length:492 start_codon:yes stop_codon:yes gene_type:complete
MEQQEDFNFDEEHTALESTQDISPKVQCEECSLGTQCKSCKRAVKKKWINNNRDKVNKAHRAYNVTPKGRFRGYKRRAVQKGYDFEFTFETFEPFILSNCYHCGGTGYGIDRLDSSKGYIVSNCVPCCSECNYSKRHLEEEDWVKHLIKIVEHKGLSKYGLQP